MCCRLEIQIVRTSDSIQTLHFALADSSWCSCSLPFLAAKWSRKRQIRYRGTLGNHRGTSPWAFDVSRFRKIREQKSKKSKKFT